MIDVVGRRMEMGGKSWGFGVGARRGEPEGGGAPGGGLVKAGRDRALQPPVVVGVGLPKPTRAASGDVPTQTNREILTLGRHKTCNNNAAIPPPLLSLSLAIQTQSKGREA